MCMYRGICVYYMCISVNCIYVTCNSWEDRDPRDLIYNKAPSPRANALAFGLHCARPLRHCLRSWKPEKIELANPIWRQRGSGPGTISYLVAGYQCVAIECPLGPEQQQHRPDRAGVAHGTPPVKLTFMPTPPRYKPKASSRPAFGTCATLRLCLAPQRAPGRNLCQS